MSNDTEQSPQQSPKLEVIDPGNPNFPDAGPPNSPPSEPPKPETISTEDALSMMLGLKVHPQMDTTLNPSKILAVKNATAAFIMAILSQCPNSLDRMGAVRKAKEAMMLAESAIETPQVIM